MKYDVAFATRKAEMSETSSFRKHMLRTSVKACTHHSTGGCANDGIVVCSGSTDLQVVGEAHIVCVIGNDA